jgi:hypothetical protein
LINNLTLYHNVSHRVQSIPERVLQLQNAIQSFHVNDLPSESCQQGGLSATINEIDQLNKPLIN